MVPTRGSKPPASQHLHSLTQKEPRGQHHCNARLGRWTRIDGQRQETECVAMPASSRQLPNGGYMSRFVRTCVRTCMPTHTMANPCMPVCLSPDATAPPKVTHRPEGTWGNLTKGKGGDRQTVHGQDKPEIHHVSPKPTHNKEITCKSSKTARS